MNREYIQKLEDIRDNIESFIDVKDPEVIYVDDVEKLNKIISMVDNEYTVDNPVTAIKQIMKDKGITLTGLAERMGTTRQNVNSKLSRGNVSPRFDSVLKIVSALGCEVIIRPISTEYEEA